jgi:hypothetical protein
MPRICPTRRGPPFRQRDVTRTIKATRAAGVEVDRVEITPGKIVVHICGSGDDNPKQQNSADAVLQKLEKAKHESGKS